MAKQRKKKDAATNGISAGTQGAVTRTTATDPPTINSRPAGAPTSPGAPDIRNADGACDVDTTPSDASARHPAGAPAAASPYRASPHEQNQHYEYAPTGVPRRRRGRGGPGPGAGPVPVPGAGPGGNCREVGGGAGGGDKAGSTTEARRVTTSDRTASGGTSKTLTVKGHNSGTSTVVASGHGGHGGPGGSGSGASFPRRPHRLWRVLQWPLVFGVTLLALAAVHQRLIEEAPLTELFQDGIVGPFARLNVTLPRPSLDALIASTGINVSALIGLTDALTDTLNDITGTIIAGRLSLVSLLPQLPAFNLRPPMGLGGGAGDTEAAGLRPGMVMARRGYRAKHPVVIVPGFVTSGLELWQGLPCGQRYFRQRMWGTLAMVQAFMTDPACWFQHMELDPRTGLDPTGIKIRAAVGLEAVDYFIQGYWVWGKLVEALADVGYDSNNLVSMSYDWRLAIPLLEERDGYFTRLRLAIEALAEVSSERVVITAHSFGENVVRSFLTWVEADHPGWVEDHVHAVINIAGTSLGVPKSISALLSGETRDTAQLGALAGFLTSNLVPRATRTRVWRTWGASYAMLPVGGPGVWGNASWAPDDTPEMRAEKRTYGAMVSLWPHDWETVLAAAAAAAPHQREALTRLVHNVSEAAEPPPPPSVKPAAANPVEVVADDLDDSSSGSSSSGSSSSSSSSSGGPMARITDTLMRLVSSGGSDIDPADYLNSEHVTRLDVSGFLALLREVGGSLVDQHVREWAAVDLAAAAAGTQGDSIRSRAAADADSDTPQAQQVLGGARRLRENVRRRIALFPDATRTPLPNAPSTSIVCLYGVGLPTERGYHYLRPPPPPQGSASPSVAAAGAHGIAAEVVAAILSATVDEVSSTAAPSSAPLAGDAAVAAAGGDISLGSSSSPPLPHNKNNFSANVESSPDSISDLSGGWTILKDISNPGSSLDVGVQLSDGDGTVPLLSLGLMCRHGWRAGGSLNPGGMRVVTREFKHRSVSLLQDARGGPATAAHIEILGNEAVMHDVIRVAAGRLDELDDVIHSDIDRIAVAVNL
ncbi:hypothetical protein VaNZ11_008503 [Volvox africanus]|uniref:Phospholipid:diacylglycerol acyltransferase n=1 Tax=Volvox africanus TaxID=51714 RepID=A0ABQ5S786_9CHLO|nr:hypothetical protein VaNZ11_008503 [Volvox africanus]